jgi:hypothetical protein
MEILLWPLAGLGFAAVVRAALIIGFWAFTPRRRQ